MVVISIIALLVSILMPALGKARRQARSVVCASNEKQWGIAINLYALDNDNHFPYNGWDTEGRSIDFCFVHPTTSRFISDYLLPLEKAVYTTKTDSNFLYSPSDPYFFKREIGMSIEQAVEAGLMGYWVLFGNEMGNVVGTNQPGPTCPNILEWVCRQKLGGKYHKAPVLADAL